MLREVLHEPGGPREPPGPPPRAPAADAAGPPAARDITRVSAEPALAVVNSPYIQSKHSWIFSKVHRLLAIIHDIAEIPPTFRERFGEKFTILITIFVRSSGDAQPPRSWP